MNRKLGINVCKNADRNAMTARNNLPNCGTSRSMGHEHHCRVVR